MKTKAVRAAVLVLLATSGVWLGQRVGEFISEPPPREGQVAVPDVLLATNVEGQSSPLRISGRDRPLIVFALRVDCQFCRRNLPNWRDITRAVDRSAGATEILVLSISGESETLAYLKENRLPENVAFVDANELQALGLPGVPGTLAVSPGDDVMRKWVGVLKEDDVAKIANWAKVHGSSD